MMFAKIPKPSPSARRAYLEVLNRMTPTQRLMKAFELSEMTRQLFKEGLRQRFPDKTATELHAIYLERMCRFHSNNS
jgi:hypothetical protein